MITVDTTGQNGEKWIDDTVEKPPSILDITPAAPGVDIEKCGFEPSLRELVHKYYAAIIPDDADRFTKAYCDQIEYFFQIRPN